MHLCLLQTVTRRYAPGVRPRAIALRDAVWPSDFRADISIRPRNFHSLSSAERELGLRVREIADEWTKRANLGPRFVWRPFSRDEPTRIRIGLEPGGGSRTIMGQLCQEEDEPYMPTMVLGLLDVSSPVTVRQVVLHEFGHALGYVHEHRHPDARVNLRWKTVDATYQQVFPGLSGEEFWQDVQSPFETTEFNTSAYDRDSIMHYPVPADWTLDGQEIPWREDLSPGDLELARRLYA